MAAAAAGRAGRPVRGGRAGARLCWGVSARGAVASWAAGIPRSEVFATALRSEISAKFFALSHIFRAPCAPPRHPRPFTGSRDSIGPDCAAAPRPRPRQARREGVYEHSPFVLIFFWNGRARLRPLPAASPYLLNELPPRQGAH
jgi:hypothetical protein